jgi:hypothetical protein
MNRTFVLHIITRLIVGGAQEDWDSRKARKPFLPFAAFRDLCGPNPRVASVNV